jgi:transposase
MSEKEADRYRIFMAVMSKEIMLMEAATLLKISYRQASRLKAEFSSKGVKGLISKKRGRRSNRAMKEDLEKRIINIIQQNYGGYGPTLLSEKLIEKHGIEISNEKIRQLLLKHDIPYKKRDRKNRAHQRRQRRDCEGELEQTDASIHAWFDDRAPKCALHLSIDDATSKIKAGRFGEQETTKDYWLMFEDYFQEHGLPRALYVDRRGVFKVNQKGCENNITQFKRSMNELGIDIIFAGSAQAKGRVERVNGTLQDRLVKELRELNISSIEAANAYLPEFIEKYNKKFGKPAASPFNAHRPLDQKIDLKRILCEKFDRLVRKNLEVQFENQVYQLEKSKETIHLRGTKAKVIKTLEGKILIEHKERLIPYKKFEEIPFEKPEKNLQEIADEWERSLNKGRKPPENHPWKLRGWGQRARLHKKKYS